MVTPSGAQPAPASAAAAGAEVEAPRLSLRRSRLDNGLRVVLQRDPSLPTVAIGIAYAVGTHDEGQDEQGFARWLQHAMFQGSRNVAAGEHARLVHELGGQHAAWTTADHTLFVDVLPAQALALGLWLEADRMKSLDLSGAELGWQRRLLELELEREAREPSRRGARELQALVFGAGPQVRAGASERRPLLDAAQLPALRAFHDRYYAPNNAVLTLVGNFEVLDALNLILSHFADVQAVPQPAAPVASPAEQAQPRRVVLGDAAGLGPALWQGWSIPGAGSAEQDALALASVILGAGVSSRLHQLLVAEKGLARRVSAWTGGSRGPDLFGVELELKEGADPEQASRLAMGQIAALGRFGPSTLELQRARRALEIKNWQRLDGHLARARALCEAELFAHDARVLLTDSERYGRVSREDVQKAVARYLRPQRRNDVLLRARGQ